MSSVASNIEPGRSLCNQTWKKTGFGGSAEPNFSLILRQICPLFRKFFTKLYQSLPKLTKVYQSLQNLPKFTNFLQKLTKFQQMLTKCVTYTVLLQLKFVVIHAFFSPNLYLQKVRVDIKSTFSNSVCSVQWVVCSVQCSLCSFQCAICSGQCAVCSAQCAVCSMQCAMFSVQCAVCSVQCPVCSVQC